MTDWRDRLLTIIETRNLNMKRLSLDAGMGETAIRDMLKRDRDPRRETMNKVAHALGMTASELFDGEEPTYQVISIIGAASAGDGWEPFDDRLGRIKLKVDGGEPVAIEVRGDSMAPVYRDGDLIIGAKRSGSAADNLIGQDYIVKTDDGCRYIKFLARGLTRGRFNLKSYSPAREDIENVKIEWAAPIIWVRRSQR